VTYTGNGVNGRTISHSLGSTPGCVIVKRTDSTGYWAVRHRSGGGTNLLLNTTVAGDDATTYVDGNISGFSSTTFTVSLGTTINAVNASGGTYVAYLFAHDAGGFGLTGTDNVISCGSFTTVSSGYSPNVELGYEPQWVMLKRTDSTGAWLIVDTMRGWVNPSGTAADDANLRPNASDAEATNDIGWPYATGFNAGYRGGAESTWIYIAIRRGPMKVPTDATKVFAPIAYAGNDVANRVITGLINAPDWVLYSSRNAAGQGNHFVGSRLQGGGKYLLTESTSAESSSTSYGIQTYGQTSVTLGSAITNEQNAIGIDYILYGIGRAPSFFDEVCYTGTYPTVNTQTHNLGVAPELMIVKRRDSTSQWSVYSLAWLNSLGLRNRYGVLNATDSLYATDTDIWNNTLATSSSFQVNASATNANGGTFVAYLFATCAGVSKCGIFTGNGSSQTIDCGFTSGARFVMIKKASGTGDWMVADSARGIVSGNDPYFELNNTNAEVTGEDWLDTDSTGFVVNEVSGSNANTSGATYIFLAIA